MRSDFARKKLLGKAEQDLATTLRKGAAAIPFAQETACREWRDVRCVRQVLVRDSNLDALLNIPANIAGEIEECLGQPQTGAMAGQPDMRRASPIEIVECDGQRIVQQCRKALNKASDGEFVPNQDGTLLHCFRADEVTGRPRQERRGAEDFTRQNPRQQKLLAFRCDVEIPGAAFRQ